VVKINLMVKKPDRSHPQDICNLSHIYINFNIIVPESYFYNYKTWVLK